MRLSDCSFAEAVQAWNDGFEGYFTDATTNVNAFTYRIGCEGLSLDLSIVAFEGERPVGIVLNGIRTVQGKKIAWNGGTGVASSHRGQGIGRLLMEETLKIYKENEVDLATLEAISENSKAIALYEKIGYQIIDHLILLSQSGPIEIKFRQVNKGNLTIYKGVPLDVSGISLYNPFTPWQTQALGIKDGEAIIVYNEKKEAVAFALYKKGFNSEQKHISTTLFQCEVDSENEKSDDIIELLLETIFQPDLDIRRGTFNFSKSNERVVNRLIELGFEKRLEQVYMVKNKIR